MNTDNDHQCLLFIPIHFICFDYFQTIDKLINLLVNNPKEGAFFVIRTLLLMNHSFVLLLLFFTIAFGAVADLKTEDEAIAFIDQEENGNEENVKSLIVKVILGFCANF